MNVANLLPIPAGTTFSTWAEKWLKEIAADLQSQLTDVHKMRERNERFGAYLPTLSMILAQYGQQMDKVRASFKAANAPGDKESKTAYNERVEEPVTDLKRVYHLIERLHDDILTRLSVSQTNIRSVTEQVKHGS